jgi:Heterokaryon incompatibility protein (HET)
MDTLPPGHIRLLHIEAGRDESLVVGKLVTKELQSAPPFEALSYTWGVVEFTSTITCDGSPMPVTQNLYEALTYLRQPDQERIMWIDAICIYSYRTATKCCRNLRFRPQFCEGFGFASHCLDSNPQKPVRALGAPLGLGCTPQHVSAKPVAWKLRILLSAR